MRDMIAASVIETTHRPGLFSSATLSRLQANFLHQTCITGFVKHLSPYTRRISEWMVFGQSHFAQWKWITERCSLRDAFSGSVAVFIVDRWCHSDDEYRDKTHSCYSELNCVQNLYIRFFIFWKLTELCRFVTYLSDDPHSRHTYRHTCSHQSCYLTALQVVITH